MNKKPIIIILLITVITIASMGIFNFFRGSSRPFVTESQYSDRVAIQEQMDTQILQQLSKYGVNDTSELMLEFFFYTNEKGKASNLASELRKLNYQIERTDTSASDNKQWVISGWTTKMKMDLHTVTNWTTLMCKLGYDFDCDFDGWGTQPDQN